MRTGLCCVLGLVLAASTFSSPMEDERAGSKFPDSVNLTILMSISLQRPSLSSPSSSSPTSSARAQAPPPPTGPATPARSARPRAAVLMATVLLDLESAVSSQHQHAVHQSPQIQLTSEIQTIQAPTLLAVPAHVHIQSIKCLLMCVN